MDGRVTYVEKGIFKNDYDNILIYFYRYCGKCGAFHDKERGCHIRPMKIGKRKKKEKPCRFVAFDLETTQHQPLDPNEPIKKMKHEANFIAAKVTCGECIKTGRWKEKLAGTVDECEVCGPNRTITFGERPYEETEVDFHEVSQTPMKDFVKWILYDLPIGYDTYAFSHFGGKFDMHFVFKELYKEGINPSMLKRGNKMYEMKVKARNEMNPNVIWRDSYNLMQMKLADLPSAFGLDVQDKPFFPYLFNRPENYGQRLPHLPPKEDYLYAGFDPAKRKKFDQWYNEHRNEPFFLDEALASYCVNDVEILMAAMVAFRSEFLEISKRPANENGFTTERASSFEPHDGLDPLRECMTIASACMRHFRLNHLPYDCLALVPEQGYQSAENQSLLALKFMQWYSEKNNVLIQNAHSEQGEKQVGPFKLDGWIENEQRGIEIHGCPYHGCEKCYPDDQCMLPTGRTAGKQREMDKARMEFIRSHVPVEIFWSCQIYQMLEEDKQMQEAFKGYMDCGPLEIRKCFYGGRTGPLRLFHQAQPGEKISYLDVTSLYPYVNFMADDMFDKIGYPVGHPNVHTLNENVDWTAPEDNPYPLALLKVFVIPPKEIDIPVLPVKFDFDNRLLFPLCAQCAHDHLEGGVDEEYSCSHTDQQRGWVSSCTSIELNEALKEGYTVTKVLRVLEYIKSDNQLFRPYMREFLAQKFHASGFDSSIAGNVEAEDKFIQECWDRFGIRIEREKMDPNKGKRSLAKLMVNNLWGRFALRNFGLWQTHITDDPAELAEYLDRKDIDLMGIDEITTEVMLISYTKKKEFLDEHDCSNCGMTIIFFEINEHFLVISLWTTSCARLILLRLMQKVSRSPGCTLIYTGNIRFF